MEAKDIIGIIDEADCNADTCFVDSTGNQRPLGWAKKLIEISFKAGEDKGTRKVVEWIKRHYAGGKKYDADYYAIEDKDLGNKLEEWEIGK